MDKGSNLTKDRELRDAAKSFVDNFNKAVATSRDDALRIMKGRRWSGFEGGILEFTPELTAALDRFVLRAAQLLGPKRAHEMTIRELALTEARKSFMEKVAGESASSRIIDKVSEEGGSEFEFLVPNHLILFSDNVRSIQIGPVSAALTSDVAIELQNRKPNDRIKVVAGRGFSLQFIGDPPVAHIEMHPIAWLVSVGAMQANVEEEAKWLIDVAISFLRLQFKTEGRQFPRLGQVEPHPLRPKQVDNVGVKIRESSAFVGGGSVPAAYEITGEVKATTANLQFCSKATLIFNPPSKSVAARVSQGLWPAPGFVDSRLS